MPEVTTPEVKEETAPIEEKKEQKKPEPKIDPTRPLSQQVGKLSEIMGDTSEKPEEKEPEAKEEEKKDEPKEAKPTVPAPVDDEDEDVEPAKPIDLGPMEKYIIERLPNITARITVDGKEKTMSVKSDAELPAGYSFSDDAARTQFVRDLTAQEIRASDLLKEYQGKEQQEALKAFEIQEAEDVASDVARLQKQGILGAFDDNTPTDDPAVVIANEIYDLYKKTNQAYAQKYMGTNRTFRISYADAADKYFAAKARTSANDSQKAKEQPEEEKKEPTPAQKEREEVAKKVGAPSNSEPTANRPRPMPGMKLSDINKLFRQGRI